MMKALLMFILLLPMIVFSQNIKLQGGLEQDVLPYATGGYFAGGWIGNQNIRLRLITALVNKPDFIIPAGFTNNRIKAYAAVIDYSLKKNWKGWFIGSGLVKWDASIQSDKKIEKSHYQTYLINGTLGYNIMLNKFLYLSPWAGLHLKIAGERDVTVDDNVFSPAILNPEASVKLGLKF